MWRRGAEQRHRDAKANPIEHACSRRVGSDLSSAADRPSGSKYHTISSDSGRSSGSRGRRGFIKDPRQWYDGLVQLGDVQPVSGALAHLPPARMYRRWWTSYVWALIYRLLYIEAYVCSGSYYIGALLPCAAALRSLLPGASAAYRRFRPAAMISLLNRCDLRSCAPIKAHRSWVIEEAGDRYLSSLPNRISQEWSVYERSAS